MSAPRSDEAVDPEHRIRRRLLLAAGGFAALAVLAATTNATLLLLDEPISEVVRGGPLAGVLRVLSNLGGTETAVLVAVGVTAASWRRCRPLAVVYPATLLVGAALNVALKVVIDRPRPPRPDTEVALASFPSGHTFQATLVLGLLPLVFVAVAQRRDLSRVTAGVAFAGVVAVAASRVVLGAHWPLDVVAGAMVGVALVSAAHLVLARWHRTGTCACTLRPTGWAPTYGPEKWQQNGAAPVGSLHSVANERRFSG